MNRLRKFESQLVEGFWSPTATYVFAVIGVTATEAIAGVAIADTAYNAYQSNKVGNASLSLAQGTQDKQDYYNNLLVNLMNDPSSVFTNPAFTASEKLGETAVAHQGAAAYGPNYWGHIFPFQTLCFECFFFFFRPRERRKKINNETIHWG